jgi:hypothetical protein
MVLEAIASLGGGEPKTKTKTPAAKKKQKR